MEGYKIIGTFSVLILISSSVLCTNGDAKQPPGMTVGAEAAVMPIPPGGVGKNLISKAQALPGNAIVVPDNCPPGQKRVAGECKEIFDNEPDEKN